MMTLNEIEEHLIALNTEELERLIRAAREIQRRKEEGDPVLKALEEAGYDFRDHCCEE